MDEDVLRGYDLWEEADTLLTVWTRKPWVCYFCLRQLVPKPGERRKTASYLLFLDERSKVKFQNGRYNKGPVRGLTGKKCCSRCEDGSKSMQDFLEEGREIERGL